MQSLLRRGAVLVVSLMLMTVPAHANTPEVYGDQMEAIMNTILEQYLDRDDVDAKMLYEAAMEGMFSVLDRYSDYLPPGDGDAYTNSLNNQYVGIGVQLVQEGDYVVVTRVFFGGPAEAAGLKVHDKIVGVDGNSLMGSTPQEAAKQILGDEGTDVTLTIDRAGYVFELIITRGTVTINAVDQLSILEADPTFDSVKAGKVGYLKIESFSRGVDEELEPILEQFKAEGRTHLLLDLRDNGGGYVDAAVAVLNMLVPEGPVLRFVNNEGREIVYRSDNPRADFEIVALINNNSASATEFVAAAIQESETGILVGETTFGKGVAQYIYELEDGSVVKLTQEEFFTGNNAPVHEIGITPDVEVIRPDFMMKTGKYLFGEQSGAIEKMESILVYLGYMGETPDEYFDWTTYEAVKSFQSDQGLYPYGVCDFTTQDYLNQALIGSYREHDRQLEAAVNALKAMMD